MTRTPLLVFAATMAACGGGAASGSPSKSTSSSAPASRSEGPTFADDVSFLSQHGKVYVLEGTGGARVAVSAKYQGRVMTSAVDTNGRSFGWINRAFIEANKTGTAFDNFGGEDRFWLGPEAGQYGLYFAPGAPFTFDAWQVPHPLQEGEWAVVEESKKRITFRHPMTVRNWAGQDFSVTVERIIELVDAPAQEGVRAVAFQTTNRITNSGKEPWEKVTGLLSVWVLAQYAGAPDMRVMIPFAKDDGKSPIVNDAYFGKVPAERLAVNEEAGFISFTCDGKLRSKIGVSPRRAKPVMGSYSRQAELLTVVRYDKPEGEHPYVNSMWEQQKQPYAGDALNSYNDGPPAPGKPALGGFYELETSSPAAQLAPGQSLVHTHRTFHFVGPEASLEPIAKSMVGVSLKAL